jgi:uncharacterized membrane protein YebE (DUF533 family)
MNPNRIKPYFHPFKSIKPPGDMNFGSPEEELAMKRYIVSLLVRQAQTDEHFTNLEKKYLAFASHKLGLSDREVAAIRLQPERYDIAPLPGEEKRMTIFYYLLFMARADGTIEEAEEQFCYHMGFQLGFREEMISSLIDLMKQSLNEKLAPEAMLERIKPYLN